MQYRNITLMILLLLISIWTPVRAKTLFSEDFSKGADRWDVGAGKWYAIKIEVRPDKVVGYLNGKKGFEVKEGPAEGRIGFSLFGTSAAFDDIVVYDKDGLSVDSSEKLATFWGQIRRQK